MVQDNQGEFLQPKTITPKIFKYLKKMTEKNAPHEKLVILSFNSFPFSHFVNVNPDRYQYGELLPSHCVVPCIRFIYDRSFHFLGSLFFYREYLERNKAKFSKDMSECIKLYILALANINLKVVATVSPCIQIFIRAIQILTHIPYLEQFDDTICYNVGSNTNIIHIHDPSHIQSEMINLFLNYDFHFDLYGVNYHASKRDIMECMRLDNRPLISRNLEGDSLDQEDLIGEYYLSPETSESIRRHIRTEALPAEALGTRLLIGMLRGMFHNFYTNTHDAKYIIFNVDRLKEMIRFIRSIKMIENKTTQYSQNARGVDPRKSKMVRNLKDIDSYISKQKSEKHDTDENAQFKENVKKLEYNIYSEMCKAPDDIQQNPNIVISTASGKTLTADSSAKKKKKKKNASIPPEVRKELIRARIAAAEGSKISSPAKQKVPLKVSMEPLSAPKVSSAAEKKTDTSSIEVKVKIKNASSTNSSKLLTPNEEKVHKSNMEFSNTKNMDQNTSNELTSNSKNKKKKQKKDQPDIPKHEVNKQLENTKQIVAEKIEESNEKDQNLQPSLKDDSASSCKSKNKKRRRKDSDLNIEQSSMDESNIRQISEQTQLVKTKGKPMDQIYHPEIATRNDITKDDASKIEAENYNIQISKSPSSTESQQKVKDMSEIKRRSPVDLEISEALMMLSGQQMVQQSITEIRDKMAKATAEEYYLDDLPELVEDSDQEIDIIPVSVTEFESSLSEVQDIMAEAKANFERLKKDTIHKMDEYSKSTVSETNDHSENTIKDEIHDSINISISTTLEDRNIDETLEKADAVPDLVEDSEFIVSEEETKDKAKVSTDMNYLGEDLYSQKISSSKASQKDNKYETKMNIERDEASGVIDESESTVSEKADGAIRDKHNVEKDSAEDSEVTLPVKANIDKTNSDNNEEPESTISEFSDIIDNSRSTLSELDKIKASINKYDIEIDEVPDLVDDLESSLDRNMGTTKSSARSNSIDIVEVPDLVGDFESTISSIENNESIDCNLEQSLEKRDTYIDSLKHQGPISSEVKDRIKDDSERNPESKKFEKISNLEQDTMNSNKVENLYDDSVENTTSNKDLIQDKLSSSGEVQSFKISSPRKGHHTYLKIDEHIPNTEAAKETLHGRREDKENEISVEKSEQLQDEIERKHLSPLQTSDNIISPSSETKKKIKTHLDNVKKIKFDDGSDKENLEETRSLNSDNITLIDDVEDQLANAPLKLETISDVTESMIYNTDDIKEKERNLRIALGVEKSPQEDSTADFQPADLISKGSMDVLVRKYLTQDQIKEILGIDAEVDTTSKFDSVVQCLRETNTQTAEKIKSSENKQLSHENNRNTVPPKPEDNLIKICWNNGDTVSIQKVSADSVKSHPKDPFKKTDLRNVDIGITDRNATNSPIKGTNKEESVSDRSTETAGSIPDFPDEFDDDTPSWGGIVDEQVKLLVESLDDDIKSGSNTATNENFPLQSEMRKTGAIKKTYERKKKESTVGSDYKSWVNFRKFVNKLCMFLKETSKTYHLPYSPDEYLEKAVEECEKLFSERRNFVYVGDGKEAGFIYMKLFRSLLGKDVFRLPNVRTSVQTVIEELDLLAMAENETNSGAGVGLINDEHLLIQSLWIHNIVAIRNLFLHLRNFEVFDELAPDLFRTDHVRSIMRHILKHSNNPSSFQIDDDCLPLDIRECFDSLKPHGSVLLVE